MNHFERIIMKYTTNSFFQLVEEVIEKEENIDKREELQNLRTSFREESKINDGPLDSTQIKRYINMVYEIVSRLKK